MEEYYARYILEKVLKRSRYTGLTRLDLEKAISEIIKYQTSEEKPKTTDLALFINHLKNEVRSMGQRRYVRKTMEVGNDNA